ncbi:MAG: hypothetical protein GXP54_05940 [Deltaproteobacteria bacterium]|nr:hypothetical protein [Deltaproteobacteria bacterium]
MAASREIKVVVSDLHLGTGTMRGRVNPYEDFHQDDRFAELVRHYTNGEYRDRPVEIIINGDFLDLLKVPYKGAFVTEVTEEVSLDKVRRCIKGHPAVFDALAEFVKEPGHRLTYIAGNHDLDVAFKRVQALILARIGVDRADDRVSFLTDQEFYRLPGGVVITHGHTFEEINRTEEGTPLKTLDDGRRVVNMPWGSLFFSTVLAPIKAERPIIDLVHPLSSFILWSLVFDLRFTLKILWNMTSFFVSTRLKAIYRRQMDIIKTLQILGEEIAFYNNLERRASRLLRSADEITALIVGHTHAAGVRRYPRNKVYVNTGTWVQTVSLDLRDLGTANRLTYAEVDYANIGPPAVRLMRWRGVMRKCEELLV